MMAGFSMKLTIQMSTGTRIRVTSRSRRRFGSTKKRRRTPREFRDVSASCDE